MVIFMRANTFLNISARILIHFQINILFYTEKQNSTLSFVFKVLELFSRILFFKISRIFLDSFYYIFYEEQFD